MDSSVAFNNYLSKTFITLGSGLAISTIVASLVSSNFNAIFYALGSLAPFMMIAIIIGEFGVAMYLNTRITRMSKSTAWACFIVYAILTGLSLASVFTLYELGSVVFALATTCVLFICMSFIGLTGKIDFSKYSSLFVTGLMTIIIVTILNSLFFRFAIVDLFIMYLGVIVFLGLIAYDIQKLRDLYASSYNYSEMADKIMIIGAFELYLDFINLFLRVLELFGKRKNNK